MLRGRGVLLQSLIERLLKRVKTRRVRDMSVTNYCTVVLSVRKYFYPSLSNELSFVSTSKAINTAHIMVNPDYLNGQRQHLQQDEQSVGATGEIRISTSRVKHADSNMPLYDMIGGMYVSLPTLWKMSSALNRTVF